MKKLSGIILCMILVLAFTATAFAADAVPEDRAVYDGETVNVFSAEKKFAGSKLPDYTIVTDNELIKKALEKMPSDLSIYTAKSVIELKLAIDAVKKDLEINGEENAKELAAKIIAAVSKLEIDVKIKLSKKSYAYTGKSIKPLPEIYVAGQKLPTFLYTVSYNKKNPQNVGTYKAIVSFKGDFHKKVSVAFKIVQATNKISAVTPAATTLKLSDVSKKAQKIQLKAVDKFGAKKTFQLDARTASKTKTYFTVSKAGKVTVKKGTPAGTYTLKVKVNAAGTSNYKALTVTKSIKVAVR